MPEVDRKASTVCPACADCRGKVDAGCRVEMGKPTGGHPWAFGVYHFRQMASGAASVFGPFGWTLSA
jgi:hypothetical protein